MHNREEEMTQLRKVGERKKKKQRESYDLPISIVYVIIRFKNKSRMTKSSLYTRILVESESVERAR